MPMFGKQIAALGLSSLLLFSGAVTAANAEETTPIDTAGYMAAVEALAAEAEAGGSISTWGVDVSGTLFTEMRDSDPNAALRESALPTLLTYTGHEGILSDTTQAETIAAVESLPDGYDTVLGEGGGGLSTGEKQLLSFARALLADPRIFVLDEATSSVDTVTEQLIQNAIDKVMNGRTSFVIAHRLSTIRKADLIPVVSDGKIIERGTHAELMRLNGEYRKLYTMQYREEQYRSLT